MVRTSHFKSKWSNGPDMSFCLKQPNNPKEIDKCGFQDTGASSNEKW